jgi:hypothetical protein
MEKWQMAYAFKTSLAVKDFLKGEESITLSPEKFDRHLKALYSEVNFKDKEAQMFKVGWDSYRENVKNLLRDLNEFVEE